MKLRSYLLTLACLCFLFSCKNENKSEGYDAVTNTGTEVSPAESGVLKEDGPDIKMDPETNPGQSSNSESSHPSGRDIAGRYIKSGEEADNGCSCYCIEVNFSSGTELCLVPGEMYINSRFERKNDNSIEVFYQSPVTSNSKGKDIPWDKFDKNEPIARITPKDNGELQLDWLGFSINNDLAVDYAIYGKKTLEGTYKKNN